MTSGFIVDGDSDSEDATHTCLETDCKSSTPVNTLSEARVLPHSLTRDKHRGSFEKSLKVESTKHHSVKKSQHQEKSVPQPQMTVERPMAFLAPLPDVMENHSRCKNTDQSLQPDSWSPEQTSVYAASPTSLYMQEQEKHDMQSSFSGCTTQSSSGLYSEEAELKPQFEISCDLASMTAASSKNNTLGVNTIQLTIPFTSTPSSWCSTSQSLENTSVKLEDIYELDGTSELLGPTLAELNATESSLLDDFENPQSSASNYVSSSSSICALSCGSLPVKIKNSSITIKSEPTDVINPCTHTVASSDWTFYKDDLLKKSSNSEYSSGLCTGLNSGQLTPSWQHLGRTDVSQAETVLSSSMYSSSSLQPNYTSSNRSSYTNSSHRTDSKLSLHQLLMEGRRQPRHSSVSLPASSTVSNRKRTISEAGLDSQDNFEDTWKEIEEFIHEDSKKMAPVTDSSKYQRIGKRTRMDSGSSTVYSADDDYEDSDDDLDSDLDSDLEDFSDTDSIGSQGSLLSETTQTVGRNKEKQYFWQYNVQSKGPKGAKLDLRINMDDPHVVTNFEDPVFDPENSSVIGVRHRGNARKGDGNEVSPNPKKLYHIGLQLRKLTRQINGIQPSDLPSSARNKSRKEKNKLASRACRLKKKAQHEANKVKLYGLGLEQKQLVEVLLKIKKLIVERVKQCDEDKPSQLYELSDKKPLSPILEETMKEQLNVMIAGNAADYVNSVIKQVEEGDSTGGIPKHVKKKTRHNFLGKG